jgi:hypothetical protein
VFKIVFAMGNSVSLSFSVSYSSLDEYSGNWNGSIKDNGTERIMIRDMKFEYIPSIHGNEKAQKEHKKGMIDAITEYSRIYRYNREPSFTQRVNMSFPSNTNFNLTTGRTYNIQINGETLPYNRLRNNLVTLTYIYKDTLFDIVIKNNANISSLPRAMF